jgi:aminoglycoside 6'-N-acetyltransferase
MGENEQTSIHPASHDDGMPRFTWRRLVRGDFPLLASWLAEPHVKRWWNQETSAVAVERDFGPAANGEEQSENLVALADGQPCGLVQRSWYADYPQYIEELAPILVVPDTAISIDYLIGDPEHIGRGIGSAMIRSVLQYTWSDQPAATCVIVPVSQANRASWRALEKAGFRRVAKGDLVPDNPIDDPAHYVYRIDRP